MSPFELGTFKSFTFTMKYIYMYSCQNQRKEKKTNEIILSKLEEKEIYTPQMAMNLERSTTPQIVQYSVLLLKKTLHRKGGQSNQLIIRK